MTTIACDGKSIASDGLVTGDGIIHEMDAVKVFTLRNGGVVGMTGSMFFHNDALDYLNGERDEIDFGDEFEAIVLYRGGVCYCFDGKGRKYKQSTPCASGSGASFALAAMLAGRDARGAVEIACKLDSYSGGQIRDVSPQEEEVKA